MHLSILQLATVYSVASSTTPLPTGFSWQRNGCGEADGRSRASPVSRRRANPTDTYFPGNIHPVTDSAMADANQLVDGSPDDAAALLCRDIGRRGLHCPHPRRNGLRLRNLPGEQ